LVGEVCVVYQVPFPFSGFSQSWTRNSAIFLSGCCLDAGVTSPPFFLMVCRRTFGLSSTIPSGFSFTPMFLNCTPRCPFSLRPWVQHHSWSSSRFLFSSRVVNKTPLPRWEPSPTYYFLFTTKCDCPTVFSSPTFSVAASPLFRPILISSNIPPFCT